MRRDFRLIPVGSLLALAGMVLLGVEVIRTITGSSLGSVASILLWVGLGLVVVGIVILLAATTATDADETGTTAGTRTAGDPAVADEGATADQP